MTQADINKVVLVDGDKPALVVSVSENGIVLLPVEFITSMIPAGLPAFVSADTELKPVTWKARYEFV